MVPKHLSTAQVDSNTFDHGEAQEEYLEGGLSLLTHIPKLQRGGCSSGSLQARRQMLYPKNCFCCSSAGSGMLSSLHPTHSLGAGWPPSLSRTVTLNLTTLCQRRAFHPVSTPKPVPTQLGKLNSQSPRHLVPESGWGA